MEAASRLKVLDSPGGCRRSLRPQGVGAKAGQAKACDYLALLINWEIPFVGLVAARAPSSAGLDYDS